MLHVRALTVVYTGIFKGSWLGCISTEWTGSWFLVAPCRNCSSGRLRTYRFWSEQSSLCSLEDLVQRTPVSMAGLNCLSKGCSTAVVYTQGVGKEYLFGSWNIYFHVETVLKYGRPLSIACLQCGAVSISRKWWYLVSWVVSCLAEWKSLCPIFLSYQIENIN